jgi:hypothetical protein
VGNVGNFKLTSRLGRLGDWPSEVTGWTLCLLNPSAADNRSTSRRTCLLYEGLVPVGWAKQNPKGPLAKSFTPGKPVGEQALAASFPTKEEADAAASKAGWSVIDDQGPNHRCPECRRAQEKEQARDFFSSGRGAYIEIPDAGPAPNR